MSNIYTIFAVVRCILINCKVFYRCNGSINLYKIQLYVSNAKKTYGGYCNNNYNLAICYLC